MEAPVLPFYRTLAPAFALLLSLNALAQQPGIKLHRPKSKAQTTTALPAAQKESRTYASADQKLTLEPREVFFATFLALNHCGYDQELDRSDAIRKRLRQELDAVLAQSEPAQSAAQQLCSFYKDHDAGDPSRNVAQYVSLALFTTPPPTISPSVKEADLPPDAAAVLGFLPVLQRFYDSARIHDLWVKYQGELSLMVRHLQPALHEMILNTDLYLKLPLSGVADRSYSVIVEPQIAPGQVNARNYGSDYSIVTSPYEDGSVKLDELRHTYLHYVLDPYAQSRGASMRRLQPLLDSVRNAPMDESYKDDISLLVIESLIKAIEARQIKPTAAPPTTDKKQLEARRAELDAQRNAAVDGAMSQGFILTRYFFGKLALFEQTPVSFKEDFPEMLYALNVNEQKKVADNTVFSNQSAGDVIAKARPQGDLSGIRLAETKLAQGDYQAAERAAQEVVAAGSADSGRALFVLAMASTKQGETEEARGYFERTLQVAKEPRLLAWSHIYLGRIADLQQDRESALSHYNAALNSGDDSADTKAAAQKGIDHPMEPPKGSDQ
ncbi:MAG: tetratricopeptide repeat protein [Acidobacteriales bacterium]|nr:tetratricopeptide repeat protein [Terriglobales bacterium]